MNYRNIIENRMEKVLDKKNELLDKYFADGRLATHRQLLTLRCLDKKYQEYAKLLTDFFNPGRKDEDKPPEPEWEWRAQ